MCLLFVRCFKKSNLIFFGNSNVVFLEKVISNKKVAICKV